MYSKDAPGDVRGRYGFPLRSLLPVALVLAGGTDWSDQSCDLLSVHLFGISLINNVNHSQSFLAWLCTEQPALIFHQHLCNRVHGCGDAARQ